MKIKAPIWFVKLYEEAQKEQEYVLGYLEKRVGYGKHWIAQNLMTCFSKITKEKRMEMLDRMDKANTITTYAWSRWNYENWDKYKNHLRFSPERYDKKKKAIILARPTPLKKFAKGLEKIIEGIIKSYEPKNRK